MEWSVVLYYVDRQYWGRNGMDPAPKGPKGWAINQMSERLSNLDMRLPNCLVRTGVLALFHRPSIHAESLQKLRVFRTKTYCNTRRRCAPSVGSPNRQISPKQMTPPPPSGHEFGHNFCGARNSWIANWVTGDGPLTCEAASSCHARPFYSFFFFFSSNPVSQVR